MGLSIGEFARRLRVTPRAVRHYEELGLLAPDSVDPRSGYRSYGPAQLVRGMQIEQLKAAGLALSAIRGVLDGDVSAADVLRARRADVVAQLDRHAAQLVTLDAILAAREHLATPALRESPPTHAIIVHASSSPDRLASTVRRTIQRLRRQVNGTGEAFCRSFSARFPMEMSDDPITIEVAAHVDEPVDGSVLVPAELRLGVTLIGPVWLIPLAYDALLDTARARGLALGDAAVEHYLDLGPVGHTAVAVPVLPRPQRQTTNCDSSTVLR